MNDAPKPVYQIYRLTSLVSEHELKGGHTLVLTRHETGRACIPSLPYMRYELLLFDPLEWRYGLLFTPEMGGYVMVGTRKCTFASVIDQKLATLYTTDIWRIFLGLSSRGEVAFGDWLIRFSFRTNQPRRVTRHKRRI